MRAFFAVVLAVAASIATSDGAVAASKSQRCETYARNKAHSASTSTGPVRGAARGALGGAVLGNAGGGAALGAAVGGTRHVAQKHRSYRYYYDACMRR